MNRGHRKDRPRGEEPSLLVRARRTGWRALLPLRRLLGDRLLGKVLFHLRIVSGQELLFCGMLNPQQRRLLFEPGFYASQYLGALRRRKGLAAHFLAYGVFEGAWPSPLFDPEYYCRQYPDVGASRLNPLTHYILYGAREGRNPHPLFETKFYLSQLGREAQELAEPVGHFMSIGRLQGLRCHPSAPNHAFAGPYEALCDTEFRAGESLAAKAESTYWPGQAGGDQAGFSSLEHEAAAWQKAEPETWQGELHYRPRFSVLVPVFGAELPWLSRLTASLERQIYPHWEAVFAVGDGSPENLPEPLRAAFGGGREQVKIISARAGRAETLNACLELATGEYVCVMDAKDALAPFALLEAARALQAEPRADAVYTDSDEADARGRLSNPVHRPAWSPEFLRHRAYIGRLLVLSRQLVTAMGGFDPAYEGVEEYELLLRLSERTQQLRHVPVIACHCGERRASAGAQDGGSEVSEKRARAVREHLARCGVEAEVEATPADSETVFIQPRLGPGGPLVSLIIPTRNQAALLGQCLESIYGKSTYRSFEVLLVDNGSDEPEALALPQRYPVRVIPYREPFNFSRANNLAAAEARGEVLVLLNNDTEVVSSDWLEQMLFYAQMPDVGAVGALLLYEDGRIQHAGVALGTRGTPHHILRGRPAAEADGTGWLSGAREVTAVTGACLMVKRRDYQQLGGLREFFQDIYQDVDFCLRLSKLGRRNIVTPRARLLHHESLTRGARRELRDRVLFVELWKGELEAGDRYFRAGEAGGRTLEP